MEIILNPSNILGWTGVIGLISTVIVFTLYQIRRSDLQLLRESIKDLSERVEFLEKENTRLKADLVAKNTDYNTVKFKKNYLKQIVLESLNMRKDISQTLVQEILDGKKEK